MAKEEQKNLLMWISLCLISFLLCGLGIMFYYKGYGTNGRIRKNLLPIVETFNKLGNIKAMGSKINAEYKEKQIIVNYITDSLDLDYIFTFEEKSELKMLKITYKETDDKAQMIVNNMIDTISILNGNREKELFEKYKFENFYQTRISEHGIEAQKINGNIEVLIATEVNVIEKIREITFEDVKIPYIAYDDIKNINNELKENSKYVKIKGTTMLYVVETKNKYIIYCSDETNNEEYIKKTLLTTVSLISPNVYSEITASKINIIKNITKKSYSIQTNPTKIEDNQVMNGSFIVNVTINK